VTLRHEDLPTPMNRARSVAEGNVPDGHPFALEDAERRYETSIFFSDSGPVKEEFSRECRTGLDTGRAITRVPALDRSHGSIMTWNLARQTPGPRRRFMDENRILDPSNNV
jgi:hypothetical protein